MSAIFKERQLVISENIPKLIKSLTGFQENDVNFKLCVEYATSRVANHRYLSVNSHDVQRRIAGLMERFMAENRSHYSNVLGEMVESLTTNPLCLEHYELDIHWSLLSFLLDASQDPVNALPRGVLELQSIDDADVDADNEVTDDLLISLAQCNIQLGQLQGTDNESDLSDWSDDNIGLPSRQLLESTISDPLHDIDESSIEPPKRQQPFVERINDFHVEHIQEGWWLKRPSLEETTLATAKSNAATTTSSDFQWPIMREILWMLKYNPTDHHKPSPFKFFTISPNTETVSVNQHALPPMNDASIDADGTLTAFAATFTILYKFRRLYNKIFQHTKDTSNAINTKIAPITIQLYANALKDFECSITALASEIEMQLIKQNSMKTYTTIWLYEQFAPQIRFMNHLFNIHERVYVDYMNNPGHICSSSLLANLMTEMERTDSVTELNILASLVLAVIRHYLFVFDVWWSEGELNDWCAEFVVEKRNIEQLTANTYKLRSGLQKCFESSPIIHLICEVAKETGFTIGTLHDLQKINELKADQRFSDVCNSSIVKLFYVKIWDRIHTMLQTQENGDGKNVEELYYSSGLQVITDSCDDELQSCYDIFTRLNSIIAFPMHLNTIIHECIEDTLKPRVSMANRFVIEAFFTEHKIRDHFNNLQNVFLFAAGDAMQVLYSQIFKKMETGQKWNNSYLLTMQLDEILATKCANISTRSLFSIQTELETHLKQPLKAIDDIRLNYAIRDIARHVFNDDCFTMYNDIFRFILKIKWSLWILERMRFPLTFRKPIPYKLSTVQDIIFKRLAMIRNWIFYSIQSIHSHFMIFVVQSMNERFCKKLDVIDCLRDLTEFHNSYVNTMHRYCFRRRADADLRDGIDQLCHLSAVLNDEWKNLCSIQCHDNSQMDDIDARKIEEQIDAIESTYIKCHTYIAKRLSKEVYVNNRNELAPLSAAFNCSCPY